MTQEEKKVIYDTGIEKVNSVYEIFKDYYEEDRVDLQNIIDFTTFEIKATIRNGIIDINDKYLPFIIVHFPEVTVTNENNDSVTIKDLWAKILISFKGTIVSGFSLNRSHYPISHWDSDYLHSHVSGIPSSNVTTFLSPCLGSGPIRDTISSLASRYDESIWMLFCRELDVYTRTESLSGGPYRRMANINSGRTSYRSRYIDSSRTGINLSNLDFPEEYKKDFILYLLNKKVLKFNFSNNTFGLGMSYYEYYITISNIFIEWYNKSYNKKKIPFSYEHLKDSDIIIPVEIINNDIYRIQNMNIYFPERLNGTTVLTFKGNNVPLCIERNNIENKIQYNHVLNSSLANNILRTILAFINYKYGRETTNNNESTPTERILV